MQVGGKIGEGKQKKRLTGGVRRRKRKGEEMEEWRAALEVERGGIADGFEVEGMGGS